MLAIDELSKQFGGLRAVDGCSFVVEPGTITGLIGPNGAGKTTVFDLITGFQKPDSGKISFRQQEITNLLPHRVFDHGICRTFQVPHEFKELSVIENLLLVPSGQYGERVWNSLFCSSKVGQQEKAAHTKALEVLELLGLEHLKDEDAIALSGGQKKLLELARTMMADPYIVLLDEPGAGVNRTLLKVLAQRIELLSQQRDATFLIIEHDMDFVMALCDPIVVMSEGRKLTEGTPIEVQANQAVLDAYLGGQYVAA